MSRHHSTHYQIHNKTVLWLPITINKKYKNISLYTNILTIYPHTHSKTKRKCNKSPTHSGADHRYVQK